LTCLRPLGDDAVFEVHDFGGSPTMSANSADIIVGGQPVTFDLSALATAL
jgi:hypothetical protein